MTNISKNQTVTIHSHRTQDTIQKKAEWFLDILKSVNRLWSGWDAVLLGVLFGSKLVGSIFLKT